MASFIVFSTTRNYTICMYDELTLSRRCRRHPKFFPFAAHIHSQHLFTTLRYGSSSTRDGQRAVARLCIYPGVMTT